MQDAPAPQHRIKKTRKNPVVKRNPLRRLIVPYAPGGNIDITARSISPGLSELLGQSVIVDNRAGAGGTIGADLVAKAAADGYTILVGSSGTLTVAPSLYSKIPYHPVRDFAPVSFVSSVPLVLLVHPSVPAKSVKELVSLAKTMPGKLTMAPAGTGTTNHLVGEMFQAMTGARFVHVPYKGSGPALVVQQHAGTTGRFHQDGLRQVDQGRQGRERTRRMNASVVLWNC